jgi:hypothetical protein
MKPAMPALAMPTTCRPQLPGFQALHHATAGVARLSHLPSPITSIAGVLA